MKNNLFKAAKSALLLTLILFAAPAMAQKVDIEMLKKSTPEQRALWENTIVKKELKMTGAQYKKVSALNLEYAKKMQPVIDSKDNWITKGKQFMALYKEKEDQLQTIYTKEQYAEYQKVLKAKMAEARTTFQNKEPLKI